MSEEKKTILNAEQTAAKGELSDKDVEHVAGGIQLQSVIGPELREAEALTAAKLKIKY